MYIYTDDDLTKINRDYLGPKRKRLPWVATYRTYGITLAVVVAWFLVFLVSGLPLNQWVGLAYVSLVASTVLYIVRRMRRDVSIWAMVRAGWQEVNVPRAVEPRPETRQVRVSIARYDYAAEPSPRWWERRARAARKTAAAATTQDRAASARRGRHSPAEPSARAGAKRDRASRRTS